MTVLMITFVAATERTWSGVDETVVEKYAEAYGRTAKDPLVDTDQGDLLLFVFLLAGVVGGFIAGYSWKELISGAKATTSRSAVEKAR